MRIWKSEIILFQVVGIKTVLSLRIPSRLWIHSHNKHLKKKSWFKALLSVYTPVKNIRRCLGAKSDVWNTQWFGVNMLLVKVDYDLMKLMYYETWNNLEFQCWLCAISYLGSNCFMNSRSLNSMIMVLLSITSSQLTLKTACLPHHILIVAYESFGSTEYT